MNPALRTALDHPHPSVAKIATDTRARMVAMWEHHAARYEQQAEHSERLAQQFRAGGNGAAALRHTREALAKWNQAAQARLHADFWRPE